MRYKEWEFAVFVRGSARKEARIARIGMKFEPVGVLCELAFRCTVTGYFQTDNCMGPVHAAAEVMRVAKWEMGH